MRNGPRNVQGWRHGGLTVQKGLFRSHYHLICKEILAIVIFDEGAGSMGIFKEDPFNLADLTGKHTIKDWNKPPLI